MTDSNRSRGREAITSHDAFEETDSGFKLTTTAFETLVTVEAGQEREQYTVEVTVPTLDSATVEDVGQTVSTDWFETFERRVQDAPGATRKAVELDDVTSTEDGDDITVRYVYTWGDAATGVDIAKTFAEYVEGTYVEGIIPGYEYEGTVSNLLSNASQDGRGGTPL